MRFKHPATAKGKKIVAVVGAGFGGLNAAKQLAKEEDVFVVLVDQRNHHLFQPLLYQVATAGLNPGDIAVPIRSEFSDQDNVEVHLGQVSNVDLQNKVIGVQEVHHELEYDYLVLACGAQHSYFGHSEWEDFAPGLKTLEQATEIRRRLFSAFELAENELDPETQKEMMTFIVVGGGPTGVELAGAIADICRTVLVGDFRRINPAKAQVILIEAGPKILATFDEQLGRKAMRDLQDLGVEIRTNARVEKIDNTGAYVLGERIPSRTVIWAAGVQASGLQISPAVEKDRAGRIKVNPFLSLPGHPEVFVIGDMAAIEMEGGKLVPGLAPAAIQEGKYAARMILADIRGQEKSAFRYRDKGQMATIGRNKAILQSGHVKMSGRLAWLGWLFIHVFYLIGFKNRIAVLFLWAWSYLFSKRGTRLITERDWKHSQSPKLATVGG